MVVLSKENIYFAYFAKFKKVFKNILLENSFFLKTTPSRAKSTTTTHND